MTLEMKNRFVFARGQEPGISVGIKGQCEGTSLWYETVLYFDCSGGCRNMSITG